MDKVRLKRAWSWWCPECGEKNFVDPVPVELTQEEQKEVNAQAGILPWQSEWMGAEMIAIPERVQCEKCRRIFKAEDPNDDVNDSIDLLPPFSSCED